MKTEILLILDRSGSISKVKSDLIGSFNSFIEEQKKIEDECNIDIVLFSSRNKIETIYSGDIKNCIELNDENFITSGYTALYEAVATSLYNFYNKVQEDSRKIVVISTDGQENNSSPEFTSVLLKDKIKELEEQGYTFIFIAEGLDAFKETEKINLNSGNVFKSKSVKSSYNTLNSIMYYARSASTTSYSNTNIFNQVNNLKLDDENTKF